MPNKRKIRGRKKKQQQKKKGRERKRKVKVHGARAGVSKYEGVSAWEKQFGGQHVPTQKNFNAYEGCRRSVASAACNYLPGFTQNKWAAVIGLLYVPFGSFIPKEAQSLAPDCFISSSTEYNWHFFNQISLDAWREGNLKKRTQKRVRTIILLIKRLIKTCMHTHIKRHTVWLFIAKVHSHENDGFTLSRKNRLS